MLTISISEALQGPAAWSEWNATDAEASAAAEAWQQQQVTAAQWGLEGALGDSEFALVDLQEGWRQDDAAAWAGGAWAADALQTQHALAQEEAAASIALAAAMAGMGMNAFGEEENSKVVQRKEAAWASPLRVPLPEPLAVKPLSELEIGLEYELDGLPADNEFEEPQKIDAGAPAFPPGLGAHSGPGPLLADAPRLAAAAAAPAPSQKPAAVVVDMAPQGMAISPAEVGGKACTRVDWKIDDFSGKLQASMGRPVVSPSFAACGLSNLRLMVFPDARDAVKSARSHERKGLYAAMVKKGPLYGSLKLKADGLERATVMTFALVVGSVRAEACTYDFSEQAVLGLDDFGVDWLQQVDKVSGALSVGIEIIEVKYK